MIRDAPGDDRVARARMPETQARLPSIKQRLTFALGAISLAVFLGASALLDWSLRTEIRQQELAEATAQLAMIRHFLESRPERLDSRRHELDDMLESHPELRVWVVGRDGAAVYGGVGPVASPERSGLLVLRTPDGMFKGLRQRLDAPGPLNGVTLLVGLDATAREQLMVEHRYTLVLVSILATAVIVALTAWATTRGLAPIATLSRHAARIKPDSPGTRLPVHGTVRELHELAQAFNQVLDRLETAYRHLDAFNADVAHELRTPLATMINGAQVTLSSSRTAEELRETLHSNLEELEALKRLVNDMLFLAQADRGDRASDMQSISLGTEAKAVAEYFDAAVHEAKVGVLVSGNAVVDGNGALVRRAIANLVSNALRYTPAGSRIEVVITVGAGTAILRVRNPGPTIRADELDRIFDRFFRVRDAGTRTHEGSGLGLSIVRAIARMHGGDAFAASSNGITEVGFTVRSGTSSPLPSQPDPGLTQR